MILRKKNLNRHLIYMLLALYLEPQKGSVKIKKVKIVDNISMTKFLKNVKDLIPLKIN